MTRKRMRVMSGKAVWRVPMMDWRVRVSTSMPEGWLETKESLRLMMASWPVGLASGEFVVSVLRRKTS